MSDFNTSNWLERCKTKFNINFAKINGVSQKVDASVVDEFIKKLQILTTGYKPKDIMNADETVLFLNVSQIEH